jgi:diguanylate cyclase
MWQLAQVDLRGRLLRLGPNPFALAALFGLVVACSMTFALGAWRFFMSNELGRKEDNDALSERLEKVGQELDSEVIALRTLLILSILILAVPTPKGSPRSTSTFRR